MPVDFLQKQEGRDAEGRFKKGWSGNPAGRPRGTRNKAIEAAELLLEGEAEALTRRAVERALEGDAAALRLCLDRIIPPRRGRPVRLDSVAPVRGAGDLGGTMAAITTAATSGAITPGEAAAGCPGGKSARFGASIQDARPNRSDPTTSSQVKPK